MNFILSNRRSVHVNTTRTPRGYRGCSSVEDANGVSVARAVRIYPSLGGGAAGGAVISQPAPLAAAISGLTDAGACLVDDTASSVVHII